MAQTNPTLMYPNERIKMWLREHNQHGVPFDIAGSRSRKSNNNDQGGTQEINGLLTYDRKPKVDPEAVAELHRELSKGQ